MPPWPPLLRHEQHTTAATCGRFGGTPGRKGTHTHAFLLCFAPDLRFCARVFFVSRLISLFPKLFSPIPLILSPISAMMLLYIHTVAPFCSSSLYFMHRDNPLCASHIWVEIVSFISSPLAYITTALLVSPSHTCELCAFATL